ncbi:MAG: cytochrome c oxidase assembly protein [Rhodospirillales bacterium]|nr:cytochrome c oxidase assembly protein [Rhodospirillales bacterium]
MAANKGRSNAMGIGLMVVAFGMLGASFAAIPLYKVFCEVTGYGGTPKTVLAAAPGATGHFIEVRFNANVNPGLPWRFAPVQPREKAPLGGENVAFYTATNLAKTPVTGIAIYNVSPSKVGKYFHKTACFCFNQQTLGPGEEMQFPLSYWVDPKIATDPSTADVHTITLSYTFFRTLADAAKSGALAKAGPHIGENPDLPFKVIHKAAAKD